MKIFLTKGILKAQQQKLKLKKKSTTTWKWNENVFLEVRRHKAWHFTFVKEQNEKKIIIKNEMKCNEKETRIKAKNNNKNKRVAKVLNWKWEYI